MQPRATIIIPVRDQAPRIALTLVALENQDDIDPRELEVIVVDDGSCDGLDAVVARATATAPYRLRCLRSASGGCRGIPRNIGARGASADLLILLDADACPSRRLVASHLAAHEAARGAVVIGDAHVVARTESLLDPVAGVPFWPWRSDPAADALRLDLDELRAHGDALLAPHAARGIYPGTTRFHGQVDELVAAGSPIAWVAVVPHNMSIERRTFAALGGFDAELRHLEGTELGLRARRHGCSIVSAREARSFHLYHWRSASTQADNVRVGWQRLCARFPDDGVEAVALWTASMFANPHVPAELGLASWRVVDRLRATPSGRDLLVRTWRLFERLEAPTNPAEALLWSFGSPFVPPPGGRMEANGGIPEAVRGRITNIAEHHET